MKLTQSGIFIANRTFYFTLHEISLQRTDRQTDGIAIAYSALSIYCTLLRAKTAKYTDLLTQFVFQPTAVETVGSAE